LTVDAITFSSAFKLLLSSEIPPAAEFLAQAAPLGANSFVAIDSDGTHWFLKPVEITGGEVPRPDIRVGGQFRVVERRDIKLTDVNGRSFESSMAGYSLRAGRGTSNAMSHFLGALSGSAQDGWGFDEFLAFARRFADLFRDAPDPSAEVIKGIWGELRFMSEAENPRALLRGWHASPYSVLDFELPAVAFEVKSTESESLKFHFRDQQLRVRRDDGWVVAVSLYRSESGVSILDLLAQLSVRVSSADYQQILSKSVDVLGSALLGLGHIKFDLRPFGIQLIRMELLPAIEGIPSSVSHVSFIQDLSGFDESNWQGLDTLSLLLGRH